MYYIYSYVEGTRPYYIGKGKGDRAYRPENHPPLPERDKIHIIAHFDDNIQSLLREWELITFLQLESEGGILKNQVKGMNPPDRTGKHHKLSEVTKAKMRKPKDYVRTAEHSEKIARQVRGRKHTDEWKKAAGERMRGNTWNKGKTHRELKWIVSHPDGTGEHITNMAKFCREHNLSKAQMSALGHSKGYHCKRDK